MALAFLKARWSNLFLATYAVPPEVLQQRLPPGLDLDMREGQGFVSLVAFDFLDTRVLEVPWPGYRNFAEINLRYYVRRGGERGVVFIREFVPQRLVAWLARVLYNEPYLAAPITSSPRDEENHLNVAFRLHYGGRDHIIKAKGKKPPYLPDENTSEHFFKEHRWGFGQTRRGKTIRYEVTHPVWQVYPVVEYQINLDWSVVYGSEWEFLGKQTPYSTVLAVGSPVAVFGKKKLVQQVQGEVLVPRVAAAPSS